MSSVRFSVVLDAPCCTVTDEASGRSGMSSSSSGRASERLKSGAGSNETQIDKEGDNDNHGEESDDAVVHECTLLSY